MAKCKQQRPSTEVGAGRGRLVNGSSWRVGSRVGAWQRHNLRKKSTMQNSRWLEPWCSLPVPRYASRKWSRGAA